MVSRVADPCAFGALRAGSIAGSRGMFAVVFGAGAFVAEAVVATGSDELVVSAGLDFFPVTISGGIADGCLLAAGFVSAAFATGSAGHGGISTCQGAGTAV